MTADELEQIMKVAEKVIKERLVSDMAFDRSKYARDCASEIGRRIVEENIKNAMPKPKEV